MSHAVWIGVPAVCVAVAVPVAWLAGQALAFRLVERIAARADEQLAEV